MPSFTTRSPRGDVDPRIGDALQTIGLIVEHDHDVAFDLVAGALTTLAAITRARARARALRLGGDIVGATLAEREADHLYGNLPGSAMW